MNIRLKSITYPFRSVYMELLLLHSRTTFTVGFIPKLILLHPAWASCQIRKIVDCACAGNDGNVFLATCGLAIPTCITARVWRTCRDECRFPLKSAARKTFPAFPAHALSAILRIWWEAHAGLFRVLCSLYGLRSFYGLRDCKITAWAYHKWLRGEDAVGFVCICKYAEALCRCRRHSTMTTKKVTYRFPGSHRDEYVFHLLWRDTDDTGFRIHPEPFYHL